MTASTRFENNLGLLKKRFPQVATAVEGADLSKIVLSRSRIGEPNLKEVIEGKEYFIHSNYHAQKDAGRWFKSLQLEGVDLLYV